MEASAQLLPRTSPSQWLPPCGSKDWRTKTLNCCRSRWNWSTSCMNNRRPNLSWWLGSRLRDSSVPPPMRRASRRWALSFRRPTVSVLFPSLCSVENPLSCFLSLKLRHYWAHYEEAWGGAAESSREERCAWAGETGAAGAQWTAARGAAVLQADGLIQGWWCWWVDSLLNSY